MDEIKKLVQELSPKEDLNWLVSLFNELEQANKKEGISQKEKEQVQLAIKIAVEELPLIIRARHAKSLNEDQINRILDIATFSLKIAALIMK